MAKRILSIVLALAVGLSFAPSFIPAASATPYYSAVLGPMKVGEQWTVKTDYSRADPIAVEQATIISATISATDMKTGSPASILVSGTGTITIDGLAILFTIQKNTTQFDRNYDITLTTIFSDGSTLVDDYELQVRE